jgi:Tfp pilus assembly pilus retraction ATPase PilT
MIQNKSSDIYFTYGEEPALRIFGEVHRVNNAPKLEDQTLEAIANILMTDEDQDLYKTNLSCDL